MIFKIIGEVVRASSNDILSINCEDCENDSLSSTDTIHALPQGSLMLQIFTFTVKFSETCFKTNIACLKCVCTFRAYGVKRKVPNIIIWVYLILSINYSLSLNVA